VVIAALLWCGPAQAEPTHDVPYTPLPATFDELPQGEATTLPWWQDGVLHVGETAIETRLSRINHRNGTTVVGRGTGYPGSRTAWYLVVGDRLKPLVTTGTVGMPRISANGRWIAWLKETYLSDPYGELGATDTRHDLVVYDAREREVRGTWTNRRTVYDDGVNGMGLWGLDNRGRAAFGLDEVDFLWKPGRRPVTIKGRDYDNYLDLDSWPRGIVRYARIQKVGVYGTVDRQGRFTKVGRIREPLQGSWSRRGDAYFYAVDAGNTYWVENVEERLRVQLGVPDEGDDTWLRPVGWESDGKVVLWLDDHYGEAEEDRSLLVRCDAASGDCERVQGGPVAGSRSTMQELR
jgi:hypothetical protein